MDGKETVISCGRVSIEPDEEGSVIFRLKGELDHHSVKEIRETIDGKLIDYRPLSVILDLSGVTFTDSAGLGLILGRYTRISGYGGKMKLTGVSDESKGTEHCPPEKGRRRQSENSPGTPGYIRMTGNGKKKGQNRMKNSVTNIMKLSFPSDSRNESFARYSVTAFAAQLDPDTEELAEIRTAVSEAVTNCIIHGYRGGQGKIIIETRLCADRTVKIKISDRGCGIEDIDQAMQPLFTTDRSGERGGMGFAIMESFCDKLKVVSKPGAGTTVTMTKKLK